MFGGKVFGFKVVTVIMFAVEMQLDSLIAFDCLRQHGQSCELQCMLRPVISDQSQQTALLKRGAFKRQELNQSVLQRVKKGDTTRYSMRRIMCFLNINILQGTFN